MPLHPHPQALQLPEENHQSQRYGGTTQANTNHRGMEQCPGSSSGSVQELTWYISHALRTTGLFICNIRTIVSYEQQFHSNQRGVTPDAHNGPLTHPWLTSPAPDTSANSKAAER